MENFNLPFVGFLQLLNLPPQQVGAEVPVAVGRLRRPRPPPAVAVVHVDHEDALDVVGQRLLLRRRNCDGRER